jgi:hypothetical protein
MNEFEDIGDEYEVCYRRTNKSFGETPRNSRILHEEGIGSELGKTCR